MCKYCDKDIDSWDDTNLLTVDLELNGLKIAEVETTIDGGNKLKLIVWSEDCDMIADREMRIQYCPVCGRKLEPWEG